MISLFPVNVSSTLSVSFSPDFIVAAASTHSGTTETVTVTPTGGAPAYTYSWSNWSGNTSLAVDSPFTATTGFDWTGLLGLGSEYSDTFVCTVGDTLGNATDIYVEVLVIRTS